MPLRWSSPYHQQQRHLGLPRIHSKGAPKLSLFFFLLRRGKKGPGIRFPDCRNCLWKLSYCQPNPPAGPTQYQSPPIVHFICCMHLINWDVTRFSILSAAAVGWLALSWCPPHPPPAHGVEWNKIPLAESFPGPSLHPAAHPERRSMHEEDDLTGAAQQKQAPKKCCVFEYNNIMSSSLSVWVFTPPPPPSLAWAMPWKHVKGGWLSGFDNIFAPKRLSSHTTTKELRHSHPLWRGSRGS